MFIFLLCLRDKSCANAQAATALRHLATRSKQPGLRETESTLLEQAHTALRSNELRLLHRHALGILTLPDQLPDNPLRTASLTWHSKISDWLLWHRTSPYVNADALAEAAGTKLSEAGGNTVTSGDSCPICASTLKWSAEDPVASARQAVCSSAEGHHGCGLTFPRCSATFALCDEVEPWRCACCDRVYSPSYFQMSGEMPACIYCGILLGSSPQTITCLMDGM